jgi:hypothetical protein
MKSPVERSRYDSSCNFQRERERERARERGPNFLREAQTNGGRSVENTTENKGQIKDKRNIRIKKKWGFTSSLLSDYACLNNTPCWAAYGSINMWLNASVISYIPATGYVFSLDSWTDARALGHQISWSSLFVLQ